MRFYMLAAVLLALVGCQNSSGMSEWFQFGKNVANEAGLGEQVKAADAVYDTLSSAGNAASLLMGKPGSYDFPLPDQLQSLQPTLAKVGLGGAMDTLKTRMNDAASKAAAEASPYIKEAAKEMTIADALGLMLGGETSVTDYFRSETEGELETKMRPVVQDKLKATGFYDQYQTFLSTYQKIPFTTKPDLDVENYVVGKTLDGLYDQMGKEELEIRKNPKKVGSDLVEQLLGKPSK